MRIEDAGAVLTGGAFGIGRATAIRLARPGAHVAIAAVAERAEAEAMISTALEWRGRCDLLISNAAIVGYGAPHEFSSDDWKRILDVNLFGAIWAMRAVLPHMLDRKAGHVSFVSSPVIQEGPGHEDSLGRQMRDKCADPEAFLRTDATR